MFRHVRTRVGTSVCEYLTDCGIQRFLQTAGGGFTGLEARHLKVTVLHEFVDLQVALVSSVGSIADHSVDFAEHSFAEALDSERMRASQKLPV
ncbi:MAG: hypothetical protein WBE91_20710 [Steroidobacteraceae bacterium]